MAPALWERLWFFCLETDHYQGMAGLGSSLMKVGPTAGALAKGFNFGTDTYSSPYQMSAFEQQNRYLFPGYGTGR